MHPYDIVTCDIASEVDFLLFFFKKEHHLAEFRKGGSDTFHNPKEPLESLERSPSYAPAQLSTANLIVF